MNTTGFDEAKMQLEMLISKRPLSFKSFGYYKAKGIIYNILGFITFAVSIVCISQVNTMYQTYLDLKNNPISSLVDMDVITNSFDKIFCFALLGGVFSFFLSIAFFIMAHMCKKIKRRNDYITEIEATWNKLKLNSLNSSGQ